MTKPRMIRAMDKYFAFQEFVKLTPRKLVPIVEAIDNKFFSCLNKTKQQELIKIFNELVT